ncbi:hypothetical protein BC941DRAFT_513162 [Chlamydoabsidia padenii]|nr:hypothetical protein BC941DRAFT_513162 [Chlamydoabsidia padenii]
MTTSKSGICLLSCILLFVLILCGSDLLSPFVDRDSTRRIDLGSFDDDYPYPGRNELM